MDLSRQSPAPTRYVGIGLVVALHLAGIYALSAGLIKPLATPQAPTTFKPLPPNDPPPPKRPEPYRVDKPILQAPQLEPIQVPPIVMQPTTESTVTTVPLSDDSRPSANTGPAGPALVVPPTTVAPPGISAPGAVCAVMPRPEVPTVNWSGDAVLQVLATVRAGRVVGSEFRVTQGAMDSKTRRALQRSVESALAGYQCRGDANFQQDFAFHLD
jgi:hypothetical protein